MLLQCFFYVWGKMCSGTQRKKKSCYFWGTEGKYGKNINFCVPVETAEELQFGFQHPETSEDR